ncbi:ribosome maturation factor RimP [Jatrophihabitans sp. DSM 45814]
MSARTPQRQQLMELLGPVITSQGYDLEDLSVTAAGRRSLIRVIVDADDGVDLDAVADISRALSELLDADADSAQPTTFSGPFVLEVSSPGVDRPLTELRHWRRAIGRLVTVPLHESGPLDESGPVGESGAGTSGAHANASAHLISGRITSVDANAVVLDHDGEQTRHPHSTLGPGRIQVEFSRPGVPDDFPPSDDSQASDDFEPDSDPAPGQAGRPANREHNRATAHVAQNAHEEA